MSNDEFKDVCGEVLENEDRIYLYFGRFKKSKGKIVFKTKTRKCMLKAYRKRILSKKL